MTSTTAKVPPQQAPPPPPPPPPPPSMIHDETIQSIDIDLVTTIKKPNAKMKTLNWRKIPKRRVLCCQEEGKPLSKQAKTQDLSSSFDRTFSIRESSLKNDDKHSDHDNQNVWLLIAKANKSIKENDKSLAPTTSTSKRIKEMLESVRRRVASTTDDYYQDNCSIEQKPLKTVFDVIDFKDLESLFSLQQNVHPGDFYDSELSPNFVRRSSMRTNGSGDSLLSSNSNYTNDSYYDDDLSLDSENILDSKKSLNVNIFLKQLKSSEDLIKKINQHDYSGIGKEKLENLMKLLPDENEQKQLIKFSLRNLQNRLPTAEKFLLKLISEISNLKSRIKFMLLQEEHSTDFKTIAPEIDKIDLAVKEIKKSKMFRDMLNLVLITGNFLNTGGYAADAAGFSLDSLSRLNDIRSNKPGVNLIHYLANNATKMNIINFLQKELTHVEPASKVCVESIQSDLSSMMTKIIELKCDTDKELEEVQSTKNKESSKFLMNLQKTLNGIKNEVELLTRRISIDLEEIRKQLADYLCEDRDTFKLNECFHHILTFSSRLKTAAEENNCRAKKENSKKDKTTTLKRSHTINLRLSTSSRGRQSLGNESSRNIALRRPEANSIKHNSHNNSDDDNLHDKVDELHEGLMKLLLRGPGGGNPSYSSSLKFTRQQSQQQTKIPSIGTTFRRASARVFNPQYLK